MSGCYCPPVPTAALITYEISKELHPDIASHCGYLCAICTHDDLGNTLKWLPPFPSMDETFKRFSKKVIGDSVSYINVRMHETSYFYNKH
jgi:hypothetical protein